MYKVKPILEFVIRPSSVTIFSLLPVVSSTTSPSINTNTGGGPSGGGVPGAGGCLTFDFGNCDPACVSVDDHGCMRCSCAGEQILFYLYMQRTFSFDI